MDLHLDVFSTTTYFSLWAKGELLQLQRKYDVIELMLAALGATPREPASPATRST